MKVRLMPYFVSSLLLTLTLAINSCSSSQQQQQQEAVAGQQQGQEEIDENQQQGNELANQQGEEFENQENFDNQEGDLANQQGENFDNQDAMADQEGMDMNQQQYADNQEMANEDNAMGDELAEAQEEGDLEDIVEEMNQTAGVEEAPIQAEPAPQGVDNPAANPAATDMANAANIGGDMSPNAGMNMQASNNLSAGTAAGGEAMAPAAMGGNAMATTAATDGLPEMGAKMSYIVQKGDTLGKIAAKIYGDMSRWRELAAFTGVANPSLIYPGDLIYYQLDETSVAFARTYENITRSEVVVEAGDTLAKIATRVLGDSQNWRAIWRQNDNINDPDKLVAGDVLFYISADALATLSPGAAQVASHFVHPNLVQDTVQVIKDMPVFTLTDDQKALTPVLPISEIDPLMI